MSARGAEGEVRSADGTRLAVRREGAGAPLVVVHGSGGGLDSWAPVAGLLAETRELWSYARRGYGPSDLPAGPKSFADDVADAVAVLDAAAAAGGGPVDLAGSSYGAIVALHVAVARPAALRSIALWEPPLFAAGPRVGPLLERYRAALARDDADAAAAVLNELTRVPAEIVALVAAAGAAARPDPEEARRSAVGWLHDLEALAADSADAARWRAVAVPALLLQGADTWEPMPTAMEELAAVLPDLRRTVLEGQSHFAPSTAPEAVAEALRRFLAAVGG